MHQRLRSATVSVYRSEDNRRSNLSLVLSLLHHGGVHTRAELTRMTGLNRSTVGYLIGLLVEAGLVYESSPSASNQIGRPSLNVHPAANVAVLAVNPEVDAITLAAVGFNGQVLLRERIEVERIVSVEDVVRVIDDMITRWRLGSLSWVRFLACGIAVPGIVRASDGLVRWAPHLLWSEAPIRLMVAEVTGLPTVAGNDASLGALAEHLFGAGRGVDDLVYLNGGASGIGGALIVNGRLIGGAKGYAGEFGQNRLGIFVESGRRTIGGVLEDEVNQRRLLEVLGLCSADEPTLAEALRTFASVEVVRELARQRAILATALSNAVNVLNPAMVVLGGFLAMVTQSDETALRNAVVAQAVPAATEDLVITVAALGEDRLLIGAAEAAFANVLFDPLAY